jgi:Carbohydrate binding domain (family 11)
MVLAAGCDPSLDPIRVGHGCPESPLRGPASDADEPADRLVSDFEGGSTQLAQVAGRDGSWSRGRDLTSTSVTIAPSMACAARGAWAGHFAASPPTSWGNNWTAEFRAGGAAYDGSAYTGVSFWAAFGGANGPSFGVPFGITTVDTVPPTCTTHCEDHYMEPVTLTESWQRYEIRFSDLTQQTTPQVPMQRDQLVGFIIWTQQQCDIWIDDVRLEP